jgi:hypothetical protein
MKRSQRVKRRVSIDSELIATSSCGRPAMPEVAVGASRAESSPQLRPEAPNCAAVVWPEAAVALPHVAHLR